MLAAARAAGALGGKVCGAGGGGCLFCFARAARASRRSATPSPTAGARVLDFTIERDGLMIEIRRGRGRTVAIGGQPRHRPRPRRDRRSPRDQGREPVQDPRVPQRRRDDHRTCAERVAALHPGRAARHPRHRQGSRGEDRRARRHRHLPLPPGTAAGVSADDPRPAAPAGGRPEDRRAPLPRPGDPDARRARARGARRPDPRAEGHGRQEGDARSSRRSRSASASPAGA